MLVAGGGGAEVEVAPWRTQLLVDCSLGLGPAAHQWSDQETGQIKSCSFNRTLDKNHSEFEKVEVNEAWLILRENVH